MESNVDMEELQYQAFQELEEIVNSCDDIDTLIDAIFEWQTKYRIVDIEMFFVDEELAIKAKNLLSKAFEKFKEKQEAEQVLVHSLQKKTFLRLYDICSDAKNYKDFETTSERLKDWLKDHPENTWDSFEPNYKEYFEKFANEKYLDFITGHSKQDEVVQSLEDIVDYSIRYSNFSFFEENVQIWDSNYANRDNFLSSDNKNKIDELIEEGYKRLTPPEIDESSLSEFETPAGAILLQSLSNAMTSSDKAKATIDWFADNAAAVATLPNKDYQKISELVAEKFKINVIPTSATFTNEDITSNLSISDKRNSAINYIVYKMNSSNGLTVEDKILFEELSIAPTLSVSKLLPDIVISNELIKQEDEILSVEEPIAEPEPVEVGSLVETVQEIEPVEEMENIPTEESIAEPEPVEVGSLVETVQEIEPVEEMENIPTEESIAEPEPVEVGSLVETVQEIEPVEEMENIPTEESIAEPEPTKTGSQIKEATPKEVIKSHEDTIPEAQIIKSNFSEVEEPELEKIEKTIEKPLEKLNSSSVENFYEDSETKPPVENPGLTQTKKPFSKIVAWFKKPTRFDSVEIVAETIENEEEKNNIENQKIKDN